MLCVKLSRKREAEKRRLRLANAWDRRSQVALHQQTHAKNPLCSYWKNCIKEQHQTKEKKRTISLLKPAGSHEFSRNAGNKSVFNKSRHCGQILIAYQLVASRCWLIERELVVYRKIVKLATFVTAIESELSYAIDSLAILLPYFILLSQLLVSFHA